MSATMSLDELADRLKSAAETEVFAINIMECAAARAGAPAAYGICVENTRAQARALGLAHRIALALQQNPTVALGLGLGDLAELAETAKP